MLPLTLRSKEAERQQAANADGTALASSRSVSHEHSMESYFAYSDLDLLLALPGQLPSSMRPSFHFMARPYEQDIDDEDEVNPSDSDPDPFSEHSVIRSNGDAQTQTQTQHSARAMGTTTTIDVDPDADADADADADVNDQTETDIEAEAEAEVEADGEYDETFEQASARSHTQTQTQTQTDTSVQLTNTRFLTVNAHQTQTQAQPRSQQARTHSPTQSHTRTPDATYEDDLEPPEAETTDTHTLSQLQTRQRDRDKDVTSASASVSHGVNTTTSVSVNGVGFVRPRLARLSRSLISKSRSRLSPSVSYSCLEEREETQTQPQPETDTQAEADIDDEHEHGKTHTHVYPDADADIDLDADTDAHAQAHTRTPTLVDTDTHSPADSEHSVTQAHARTQSHTPTHADAQSQLHEHSKPSRVAMKIERKRPQPLSLHSHTLSPSHTQSKLEKLSTHDKSHTHSPASAEVEVEADVDHELDVDGRARKADHKIVTVPSLTASDRMKTVARSDHDEKHSLDKEHKSTHALESTAHTHEGRFTRFMSWLIDNGAKFPHLTLKRYARDYRGVHITTRHDIPRGKLLLTIPHRMLITVELARASPIGKLLSTVPSLGSQAVLAVYLLQEKLRGEESFWKPWLDVLPRNFDTLPLFFGQEHLDLLRGCDELLAKVAGQRKGMQDEYTLIMKIRGISKFPGFTFDQFVWACLGVGTRVFSLCINGVKTSVLAPLADMMNHRNPSGTNWTFDNRKDAFTLTSCHVLRDSDAVYESYGAKCNKRFFASYGFCLDDNSANEVTICIPADLVMDHKVPPARKKSQIVVRQFIVRACHDSSSEELLSFLRLANAHDYQIEHQLERQEQSQQRSSSGSDRAPETSTDGTAMPSPPSPSPTAARGLLSRLRPQPQTAAPTQPSASSVSEARSARGPFGPISVDNELSALYALRCACKDHLRAYPTTLDEDIALLGSPSATGMSTRAINTRNCLLFRIGEKRVYRFYLDWATIAISLLCQPWEQAKLRLRAMLQPAAPAWAFATYISGVIVPLLQERHLAMHQKRLEQTVPSSIPLAPVRKRDRSGSDVATMSQTQPLPISKERARYNSVAAVLSNTARASTLSASVGDYAKPQYKSPPRLTALADAPGLSSTSTSLPTIHNHSHSKPRDESGPTVLAPLSPFARSAIATSSVVRALSFANEARLTAREPQTLSLTGSGSASGSSNSGDLPDHVIAHVPSPPLVNVELNPGPKEPKLRSFGSSALAVALGYGDTGEWEDDKDHVRELKTRVSAHSQPQSHPQGSSIRAVLTGGKDTTTNGNVGRLGGKKAYHISALPSISQQQQQPPQTAPSLSADRQAANAPKLAQRRLGTANATRMSRKQSMEMQSKPTAKPIKRLHSRMLSVEMEIPQVSIPVRRGSRASPVDRELPTLSITQKELIARPILPRLQKKDSAIRSQLESSGSDGLTPEKEKTIKRFSSSDRRKSTASRDISPRTPNSLSPNNSSIDEDSFNAVRTEKEAPVERKQTPLASVCEGSPQQEGKSKFSMSITTVEGKKDGDLDSEPEQFTVHLALPAEREPVSTRVVPRSARDLALSALSARLLLSDPVISSIAIHKTGASTSPSATLEVDG